MQGEDGQLLDALAAEGAGGNAQEHHGQGQQEGAAQDCLPSTQVATRQRGIIGAYGTGTVSLPNHPFYNKTEVDCLYTSMVADPVHF